MESVMKAIFVFLTLSLFIVFFNSCVSVNTTSFTDPEFFEQDYSLICVYADVNDYHLKKYIEETATNYLLSRGIQCYVGSILFPPTRDWDDATVREILMQKNVDGYLLITRTDSRVKEHYTPGKTEIVTKVEKQERKGKVVEVETTEEKYIPPKTRHTFYNTFRGELIDVASNKTAWVASSQSVGSDLTFASQRVKETIADMINQLREDGKLGERR